MAPISFCLIFQVHHQVQIAIARVLAQSQVLKNRWDAG
jgi:hypothetical protein